MRLCKIIISLFLIDIIINSGIASSRVLVEAERRWFLRALEEEQRHIGGELLASAADGDLQRLENALEDSCSTLDFGLDCLDINVLDSEGRTPLIIAAINGHVEVVKPHWEHEVKKL